MKMQQRRKGKRKHTRQSMMAVLYGAPVKLPPRRMLHLKAGANPNSRYLIAF